MKHIKLFEMKKVNQVEEYFKDKINWKFFNYIKDRLTEYEDRTVNVYLTVCTYSNEDEVISILYEYSKIIPDGDDDIDDGENIYYNKDNYVDANNIRFLPLVKQDYIDSGLIYVIMIGTNNIKKLNNSLQNKCEIIELPYEFIQDKMVYGKQIIVKPK